MELVIEGVKVSVSDDFASLSPREQEATVIEIADSLQITPANAETDSRLEGAMSFLNEGIARTLGAPVDIVAAGLNRVGIETGDSPVGGSDSIRAAMGAADIAAANRAPQTMGERALLGAGEAAGALLPGAGALRAVGATGQLGREVATDVSRPFLATPGRAVAAEMAAGAGARVGEAAADRMSDGNGLARAAGGLLGGLAAATGPGAALRAGTAAIRRTPVVGTGIRAAQAAVVPFTEAGARVRATDRIRSLVSDPEATREALRQRTETNLTPAQQLDDPNLLALERTAAETDPRLRDRLAERSREAGQQAIEGLRAPANGESVSAAQRMVDVRREQFRTRLQGMVQLAENRARARVERLDPARRESENAVIVREEIDRAYDRARGQESKLWDRVPRVAQVPTDRARAAYDRFVAETGRPQQSDIPHAARAFLSGEEGGFAEMETVQDVYGLYSSLRQSAREAMAGPVPRENVARIANGIADAILEDLGAVGPETTIGRTINEARSFSREVNETFGQGTVGMVTARQRTGGPNVAPETTLARSVGLGGVRGAVAVDDIRGAAGSNADASLEDYLRGRLMEGVRPFTPERADGFVSRNRETLQRFPDLQADISNAQDATRTALDRASRVADITRALDNSRESVTAAFINARAGDEIAQAVFQDRNPTRAAAILANAARRDETGRALDGLKGGFLDYLTRQSNGGYSGDGSPLLNGDTLNGLLQDTRTRAALGRVFTAPELGRMDRLARELQGLQHAREGRSLDAVMNDAPNSVISLLSNTAAARMGAQAGQGTSGASLLTANFATRRMRRILDSLTNDRAELLVRNAIEDRELFAALLRPVNSPEAARHVERRLTEWLLGTGAVVASETGDPRQASVGAQERAETSPTPRASNALALP
ncbi:hypothetical protein [Wenxinia saemankumensis]|uniref:Uncharacterized protein n=1 Tax=Wenxinia saemankumensis TaxID=1447782 RepID=A0A1M6HQJ4_9RHOB|nr:hypothetical protein [Wenxinia saemankumensis]SHJ24475.1 hypothetical protein SAMN05444417_3297 [Wenxinia saemankumensis]